MGLSSLWKGRETGGTGDCLIMPAFSKCTALWNFQLRQQLSSSQRENEKHQIQQVQENGIKAKESKGTKKNLYKLK